MRHFLGGCFATILVGSFGCGGPSLLQCRLDAVSRLPLSAVEDPDSLTVGDARTLARELKACGAPEAEASDAGAR